MNNFKKYSLYIQLQFNILLSPLLICQALVLAWKLDDSSNTYDWGIVFLPMWAYLLVQYSQYIYYSEWCKSILRDIDYAVVCTVCVYTMNIIVCVFTTLSAYMYLHMYFVYFLLIHLPFTHIYTYPYTYMYTVSHLPFLPLIYIYNALTCTSIHFTSVLVCVPYTLHVYTLYFTHMYLFIIQHTYSYIRLRHSYILYTYTALLHEPAYTRGNYTQTIPSRAYKRNVTYILWLYMYTTIYVNLINLEIRICCIILCVYDVITCYYSSGVLLMYCTNGLVFPVLRTAMGTHRAYEINRGC